MAAWRHTRESLTRKNAQISRGRKNVLARCMCPSVLYVFLSLELQEARSGAAARGAAARVLTRDRIRRCGGALRTCGRRQRRRQPASPAPRSRRAAFCRRRQCASDQCERTLSPYVVHVVHFVTPSCMRGRPPSACFLPTRVGRIDGGRCLQHGCLQGLPCRQPAHGRIGDEQPADEPDQSNKQVASHRVKVDFKLLIDHVSALEYATECATSEASNTVFTAQPHWQHRRPCKLLRRRCSRVRPSLPPWRTGRSSTSPTP